MRVSSYFKPTEVSGEGVAKLGNAIYKGQVQRVIYSDDPENVSKLYTEYDVLIELDKGVSLIKAVPTLGALGGANDYSETIYEPAEFAATGKNDATNTFQNRNGTIVAVAFWNGKYDRPVIIGAYMHPKKSRRKKADGISHIHVFRGLKTEINKDGEWSITYQSPYGPDGKLKSEATGPSFIKLNKAGGLEISLKKGTIKETHDVDSEKTTWEYKSGLKVEFDGKGDKVVYTTKGGPKVTIDGAGTVMVEANATKIIIDGNAGKISLTGSLVDVGEAASALAVLGPQLLAWLSSHTHLGDGPSIPPAPTSPPLVPPPSTLLSKSVKIKD